MSDVSPGPGRWQASGAKSYAPEMHPDQFAPLAVPQPPVALYPHPSMIPVVGYAQAPIEKMASNSGLTVHICCMGQSVGAVLAVAIGSVKKATTTAPTATPGSPETTPTPSPTAVWASSNSSTFTTIGGDPTAIGLDASVAASSAAFAQLTTDCQGLGNDITGAKAPPLVPDPASEGDWISLLTTLSSVSQDRVQGISRSDPGLRNRMATETTTSNGDIASLKSDLAAAG